MKKIIGFVTAVSLLGGTYLYLDNVYRQVIENQLESFSSNLKTQNITFSYDEIDATVISNDINIKNLSFVLDKDQADESTIFIGNLNTNRDTFTADEHGLFPKMSFKLTEGYLTSKNALENSKAYFDLEQQYEYDQKTKNVKSHFVLDIKDLTKITSNSSFKDADSIWQYASDINTKTGDLNYEIKDEDSFNKAFGKLAIEEITLSVSDSGLLDKIAEYGISLGQASDTLVARKAAAEQFALLEKSFPNLNNSLSKVMLEGGTVNVILKQDKPVLLSDIMLSINMNASQEENTFTILNILGFKMEHSK